jgi:BASS family bile acid:Na+ symporter
MNINQWINLLATVTLMEMMLTIGLGVTIAQLLAVGRNWRVVLRAMLANYVVVPAAAIGLLLLFKATPMVAAGFVIAAVCPGAPYGPPFTSLAKGNVITAVGLMVILAGSSAIVAPLLLRLLLPLVAGGQELQVNAVKMVMTLAVSQFLPLCAGLFVCQKRPALAAKLKKPAGRLCTLLNLALLGIILSVQFRMLAQIRLAGYVGMLSLVTLALLAGWIFGESSSSNRKTMAVTTAVRNVGVALVIASSSFAGTAAVTAATAYGLFQTVAIALLALGWGRLASAQPSLAKVATA